MRIDYNPEGGAGGKGMLHFDCIEDCGLVASKKDAGPKTRRVDLADAVLHIREGADVCRHATGRHAL